MNLSVTIPSSRKRLEKDIAAIQWQLQQGADRKTEEILLETLSLFQKELEKQNNV